MSNDNYIDLSGTIRAEKPEKTLENIRPYFSNFGITRVANITGLDNVGIPVALCVRPNAKSLSVSQGKGLTQELATVSAAMESIEHWHAENLLPADTHATYETLSKDHRAIDPCDLGNAFFQVEHLRQVAMDWHIGEDLRTKQPVYVPTQALSLDSTRADQLSMLLCASTNGLASGNTKEEAICHALYEVIERDSHYHWRESSATKRKATSVKISSITTEPNAALIEKLHQAKVQVRIWELTTSLGIPTYQCSIYDSNLLRKFAVFGGSGTHINKDIALARAITEAAQSRLTIITGSRDDMSPSFYQEKPRNPEPEDDASINFTEQKISRTGQSFEEDIRILLERLNQHNYQSVILCDFTKPEFNIPVVRVLIPGMKFQP